LIWVVKIWKPIHKHGLALAPALKAIQELKAANDDLEAAVGKSRQDYDALRGEINALKAMINAAEGARR
jgi:predicted  nucleic acid-binding Zn-ribbon protein